MLACEDDSDSQHASRWSRSRTRWRSAERLSRATLRQRMKAPSWWRRVMKEAFPHDRHESHDTPEAAFSRDENTSQREGPTNATCSTHDCSCCWQRSSSTPVFTRSCCSRCSCRSIRRCASRSTGYPKSRDDYLGFDRAKLRDLNIAERINFLITGTSVSRRSMSLLANGFDCGDYGLRPRERTANLTRPQGADSLELRRPLGGDGYA